VTLTKQAKAMRRKYTDIRRYGRGFVVTVLRIGVQTFVIGPGGTLREAQWMRDMLANALAVMVKTEKECGE
jgi:hypothetical protein